MFSLFRFRKSKAYGLGLRVEGLALEQPQSHPLSDGFMTPRYMVRGTLAPIEGGTVKYDRGVLAVGITGNGSALQGQLALQALAKMQNGG